MNLTKLHLHWRSSAYKNNVYRSYSLARAYRKNGKNKKEIIWPLGKLSEQEVMRWKNILTALKHDEAFFTTLNDIDVLKDFDFLDLAVVNKVWDEWEIDKAFGDSGKKMVDVQTIAKILTLNRCLAPVSKVQIENWYPTTWLPHLLQVDPAQINSSRIFRELDAIEEQKEKISRHLYHSLLSRMPDAMQTLFYDLSSASFSGSKCHIMKWGLSKEGYTNHVVLALVVNKKGMPFYWEVLPGNTADATTIVGLVSQLKQKFNMHSCTLVFDRGMVSDDNLTMLEESDIRYISAMDKNQIEKITDMDFMQYAHLHHDIIEKQFAKIAGFRKLNEQTWFREVKVKNGRRYILCFNPQLFKDQRQARIKAIEQLKEAVEALNNELQQASNSRERKSTKKKFKRLITKFKLSSFVQCHVSGVSFMQPSGNGQKRRVKTFQGRIELLPEKERATAQKTDGFWLLVTNHREKEGGHYTWSAPDAIVPYREKTVIEGAFRDIKTFVEVSPFHVWTEKHVKAHFTVCVLAYFINRFLELKMKTNRGVLTGDVVSHEKLYDVLHSCKAELLNIKNVGLKAYKIRPMNNEQKEILERLNYRGVLKDISSTLKAANQSLK